MSFTLDWLDLREPADHAARDRGLLAAASGHLLASEAPVAVDLGAGSGSTVRAFGSRGERVRWRLVDRDARLLAAAAARLGASVEPCCADLAAVEALPLAGSRLVTASALFDLVSAEWIERLADRVTADGIAIYAALIYEGTTVWDPGWPEDHAVLAGFNAHQRRKKGFGPALGPGATAALVDALADRDYRVETAPTPWRLRPEQGALQAALAEGIAGAAEQMGVPEAASWGQARRAAAIAGLSSCIVGHLDLLALPA